MLNVTLSWMGHPRGEFAHSGVNRCRSGRPLPTRAFTPNSPVTFSGSAYHDYRDESSLAARLTPLLTELLHARKEAQVKLIRENTNLTVSDGNHWDAETRRFWRARENLELIGESAAAYIRITSVGMSHADVTIAPNAFDDLSESAFLAGLNFAYSDLWTDWCEAVQDLKDKKAGYGGLAAV